jgi:hypothetical protein
MHVFWLPGEIESPGCARPPYIRLIKIARHEVLIKSAHAPILSLSWMTLYELSKLDAPRLEWAIDRGEISPRLEQAAARKLDVEI